MTEARLNARAVYRWFDRWLTNRKGEMADELPTNRSPRGSVGLCDGQVNQLSIVAPLPMALQDFGENRHGFRCATCCVSIRMPPILDEIHPLTKKEQTLIVCTNESRLAGKKSFSKHWGKRAYGAAVDPQVGKLRPNKSSRPRYGPVGGGRLIAHAFLIESAAGMRVAVCWAQAELKESARSKSMCSSAIRAVATHRRD
jgi:hypothetical protein